MELFDRFYALHHELDHAKQPVSMHSLCQRLECSRSTVKRVADKMKLYYNAPIHYDRKRNGYLYQQHGSQRFELPGIWFTPSEILALLTFQSLLSDIQPGLLNPLLAPLNKRIDKILEIKRKQTPTNNTGHSAATGNIDDKRQLTLIEPAPNQTASPLLDHGEQHRSATAELAGRIRLITQAARRSNPTHLAIVADALGQRKRLHIHYHGRGRDQISQRDISPQRLTHYRDNWYLEAWCHQADALRLFSLDRIQQAKSSQQAATDTDLNQLSATTDASYGIFSGGQPKTAVLLFNAERARWIADERWHPEQQGSRLEDGRYRLELPYTDPRELILDILRYGPDVEVLDPPELRQAITSRLQQALAQYQ